jgi:hypothetical protein
VSRYMLGLDRYRLRKRERGRWWRWRRWRDRLRAGGSRSDRLLYYGSDPPRNSAAAAITPGADRNHMTGGALRPPRTERQHDNPGPTHKTPIRQQLRQQRGGVVVVVVVTVG